MCCCAVFPAHKCTACGALKISIPAIETLHRVIALAVLHKISRFSGAEVRFLRKYLRLSGIDFAKRIGASPETVSKWENDPIFQSEHRSERLLRLAGGNHGTSRGISSRKS